MQSKLSTVSLYMKSVPPERAKAMRMLRKICQANLQGYEESMEYGIPSYKRNRTVEVAFNSQKNFIALYILKKEVLDNYRDQLKGLSLGKGCIRYTKPEKIDFGIVKNLLVDSAQSKEIICRR